MFTSALVFLRFPARRGAPKTRPSLVDLVMVEMQEPRGRSVARPAVADFYLVDRLRIGRQSLPETERLEHPPRRQGQRVGPPVEFRVAAGVASARVDDHAGHATRREGQSERRPVQAATDDQDIMVSSHAREYGPRKAIVHAVSAR